MIRETVTNLYPFIVSQLPKKYGIVPKNRAFFSKYTVLNLDKGSRHTLYIHYDKYTEAFQISLRKPCGNGNQVVIHKYV